ncbi:unnamed protein product, partial [Clonostachys chloroleuca]
QKKRELEDRLYLKNYWDIYLYINSFNILLPRSFKIGRILSLLAGPGYQEGLGVKIRKQIVSARLNRANPENINRFFNNYNLNTDKVSIIEGYSLNSLIISSNEGSYKYLEQFNKILDLTIIRKANFLEYYTKAHKETLIVKNIKLGFRAIGIYPLNCWKALNKYLSYKKRRAVELDKNEIFCSLVQIKDV